ncbi:MAG: M1 family aminopeptidase [Nonlabens sp.]
MFSTIYLHELRTWFKKPLFYIYAGVIFLLALLLSATAVGVFDSDSVTVVSTSKLNSAVSIYGLLGTFALLVYLLIPSIVGGTIQRDFNNKMHNVLYSYPLTKLSYLAGKFAAGITITLLVILASMIGVTIGFYLPGANEFLLGPFEIMNYLQPFLIFVIPNVIFYGAIVFAVTAFARNTNLAFMVVLVLVILQTAADSSATTMDDPYWVEILEPTGNTAVVGKIKYWTPQEQSTQLIPVEGTLLYNRLLWAGIALSVLVWIYFAFSFSQSAVTLGLRSKNSARVIKRNFGTIQSIKLPKVSTDFSLVGQLKTAWIMAKSDIKYIITGYPFIIISTVCFAFSLLTMLITGQQYGTDILPKTWVMLQFPSAIFSIFTYLLIFLYTGFVMDRAQSAHLKQIVDATPTRNWVMLLSKGVAVFFMVLTLLLIVIASGVIIQIYNGYFELELPLYFFDLYLINIWNFLPWILMSLLIHSLIKNKWLGLITLLVIALGIPELLQAIGVQQSQFIFNQGSGAPSPSDMNGYGESLSRYFTYRTYWILLGIALFALAVLFYRRGMGTGIGERFAFAKARLSKGIIATIALSLIGFIAIGGYMWKVNNIDDEVISGKEREEMQANFEKELKQYEDAAQPRVVSVNTTMDIFPYKNTYSATAQMMMVNQSQEAIDTLHVMYSSNLDSINLNRAAQIVYDHEDYEYRMYELEQALQPGDTLQFDVAVSSGTNTFYEINSPVLGNGTFLNNGIFPSLGYNDQVELVNKFVRKRYGLEPKDQLPDPTDPGATDDNYIGGNSDWIDFEATVSTAGDQIAIAPGYLIKEWEQDDRKYFHYKMDSKMLNFYNFMSGRYDVLRDNHDGVALEIYYHPDHDYNIDRMMQGLKDGLDYYNDNYTPYQHRQARIIEFPRSGGGFAQAFPNTIPFSEAIGFIADVDDEDNDAVDYPFSVTAHELAHQWWAHQVIGARAKGMTLLSESLSEYSSLKVLEKRYGKEKMRKFLKDAMDGYLQGRTFDPNGENALMYNENQQYIHYQKGSLVLYAMSDYLGEKPFNSVIKRFAEKYQFKAAPYPTSVEFVEDIRAITPDSLRYLVTDMFETITLYDNKVLEGSYKKLGENDYEVSFDALVSKYRSSDEGKSIYVNKKNDSITYLKEGSKRPITSLPLADYIEVGVYGEEDEDTGIEKLLYLKKIRVDSIFNNFKIRVKETPVEVGIDPYNKLIDRNSSDNRQRIVEAVLPARIVH